MRERLAGAVALAGVVAVLLVSARALPAPPRHGVAEWLDRVGPVVAAMALVRVAALASAVILLLVWVASAAAEAAGAVRVAAWLERLLPPLVRRVLGGVAGVGAVGSALVAVAPGSAPSAADPPAGGAVVATMSVVDPDAEREDDAEVTMRVEAPPAASPASPGAADEWVVEPGDSFWSIAEEVVAERLGRPAGDDEVAPYWARLVEANRPTLVTGDPDLIFPGQRLVLVR